MVYVVGVGPGSGLYLTRAGEDIIKRSQLVIGGKRNIDFIRSSIGLSEGQALYILGPDLASMMDQINRNPDKDIVVLASGDPSIYGIADYINRHMPGRKALGNEYDIRPNQGFHMYKGGQDMASRNLVIVPGIIPMNDLYITSSHGRQLDYDFIFVHDKVAILTDSKIGPRQIAQEVKVRALDYSFYVGENLSYPNQRLTVGSADDILAKDDYDMCLVILIRWRKDDEK